MFVMKRTFTAYFSKIKNEPDSGVVEVGSVVSSVFSAEALETVVSSAGLVSSGVEVSGTLVGSVGSTVVLLEGSDFPETVELSESPSSGTIVAAAVGTDVNS